MATPIKTELVLMGKEGSLAEKEERMWVHVIPIQTPLPEHMFNTLTFVETKKNRLRRIEDRNHNTNSSKLQQHLGVLINQQ